MAGAAEVAAAIVPELADGQTAWALVPNARGAELATAAGVDHLTITVSASAAYSAKNMRMSVAGVARRPRRHPRRGARRGARRGRVVRLRLGVRRRGDHARRRGRDRRAGAAAGVDRVTLADTTGVATPRRVGAVLDAIGTDVGLHLHDTRATALLNAWTAIDRGVTRFDTALGGLGGSPFAPSAGGNLATEDLVLLLDDAGLDTGVDLAALLAIGPLLADLVGHGLPSRVAAAWRRERPARRGAVDAAGRRVDGDGGRSLRHGARLRRLRRTCTPGRSTTSTASGGRSPTSSRACAGATPPDEVARRRPRCPARAGSRGASLNYAEHALAAAAARADDVAVVARSQTRDPIELTWRELADAVAAAGAGLRRLGVGAGDRVVAYAPNIPETLVAFLATASIGAIVVELRARVRHPLGRRPLRPDRAGRAPRRRRLPLRQPRTSTARPRSPTIAAALPDAAPRRRASRYLGPIAGRPDELGRPARRTRPRPADVRAGAVRPPALRAVQLGHDRPARSRSSTATAASPLEHLKVLAPAPRPRPRRPLLLVHDDRLDDVELPRVRPARRRRRSCCSTATRRPRPRHAVGPRRRHRPRPCSARRRRSSWPAARPASRPAPARCAGSARPARRCRPTGSAGCTTSVGRAGHLDQRRHRRVHRVRRHRRRSCPVRAGEISGRAARLRGRGVRRRTARRARRASRASW